MSTVLSPVQGPRESAPADTRDVEPFARPTPSGLMRMLAVYSGMVLLVVICFLLIRSHGESLVAEGTSGFGSAPPLTDATTFKHVLLALFVVIVASRGVGLLFRYMHQPAVIGEICAGILLGPSLLGWVAPDVSAYLFPASFSRELGLIAQAGVVSFMFLVGLEFDWKLVATRSHAALAIAHASIAAPFVLGSALALLLYPTFGTADVPFTVFAIFMGVSMSVTAFPVLARILSERQLHTTPVGVLALTCAAVDDATAWCLLALLVGLAQASLGGGLMTVYLSITYAIVMVTLVRPLMVRFLRRYDGREPCQGALAFVVVCLLLSAFTAETIGIHAIFGAFVMGAIIPPDSHVARRIVAHLESAIVIVLLPMFFALTGLRTEIGLISGIGAWLVCGLLILTACLGKFGGCVLAARLTGIPWREATVLATLMNTRGLMELIVLNIGLELKIIPPALFAMLVIMALVTTFMTTPVLDALTANGRRLRRETVAAV